MTFVPEPCCLCLYQSKLLCLSWGFWRVGSHWWLVLGLVYQDVRRSSDCRSSWYGARASPALLRLYVRVLKTWLGLDDRPAIVFELRPVLCLLHRLLLSRPLLLLLRRLVGPFCYSLLSSFCYSFFSSFCCSLSLLCCRLLSICLTKTTTAAKVEKILAAFVICEVLLDTSRAHNHKNRKPRSWVYWNH